MRHLVAICVGLSISPAIHAGPREVASTAFPSVVMIVTEDVKGQPLAIGSGFFIRKNLIASNAHVVEDAAGGYAKLVGQKTKFDIKGIAGIDIRHDLVLLAVADAAAPCLKLAKPESANVGDRVFSVGNPKGLEGTFADGIVSGVRDLRGEKLLQITAPISPGSSGGPILNEAGDVLGVAVATYKGGQNLNFAIPVSALIGLLKLQTDPIPFAQTRVDTKKDSYLNDLGENSRRGVEIDRFEVTYNFLTPQLEFVLRNKLREPVTNIRAVIIFYDDQGETVDFEDAQWPSYNAKGKILPPGFAKPACIGLNEKTAREFGKSGKVEYRILGFDIAEDKEEKGITP